MAWVWCIWGSGPWCLGWLAEKLLFPGFIAVIVYRFAVLQLKKKRSIDYAEKQLAEFYAPMLGARADILSHTEFDRHMINASRREDRQRLARDAKRPIDYLLMGAQKNYENALERFFANINNRLLDERIEAYIRMRTLFATKMAYADLDTREWYNYFYSFVEMWRVLRDNGKVDPPFLPEGVDQQLASMFDEELLQPFYEHLRDRCDYLQKEVSGEVATKKKAPSPPVIGQRVENPDE